MSGRTNNRHRTTLELDLGELQRAKKTLGTKTTRDTVNQALREVNRQAKLRAAAVLVRAGGLGLVRPEDLSALRRNRV
jgi:Arc/MetJ family transcription regulator